MSKLNFKKMIMYFMVALVFSLSAFAISSVLYINTANAVPWADGHDYGGTNSSSNSWDLVTPAAKSSYVGSTDWMLDNAGVSRSTQTATSSTGSSKKGGGSIFTTISSKMWKAVGGLRSIAYVIAGFGMIAFTFGAIFNKISWKHFGNIMISLFILSVMTPLIEWIAYGEGAQNKLTFGYKYVAPGDHASLEEESSCEASGNCPQESKDESDCKSNCNGDPSCEAKCGVECGPDEENIDGKCMAKCGQGQVRLGDGSCESEDRQKYDCEEGGGAWNAEAKKCEVRDPTEEEKGPCFDAAPSEKEKCMKNEGCKELQGDKYDKCMNAKDKPEKPGACQEGDTISKDCYQSKEEVCAGKEGKEKKSCEKEVDKHNKEVNKEYKKEQKEYDKEQKEIAKDKYESRKNDIAPGQEVNCDGLSASQCSRLQNKQDRADEKQAKKDQKDGIEQRYNDAMRACHGDPDCEKEAKKAKRQETNAMNQQSFANAMSKTNSAISEAGQRLNNVQGVVSGAMTTISNVTTGINNVSNAVQTIEQGAKLVGSAGSVGDVFSGLTSIVQGTGNIGLATGTTLGSVTSNLSSTANNAQDLFSSSEQRSQNWNDRMHGHSTNGFSGAMDATSNASYNAGYSASGVASGTSNLVNSAGNIANTPAQAGQSVNNLMNSINNF